MAKFISRLSQFILIGIGVFFIVIALPYFIINSKSDFTIGKNYSIVLFGHSHPECAFNDTLIPGLKNLSHSAESYFYTYQKVKKVVQQNPHLHVIMIEFSNNQIDEKMNEWTWGYSYMSSMFPLYSAFMTEDDMRVLFLKNPKDFMNCVSLSARQNLYKAVSMNFSVLTSMGGYYKIDHSQTQTPIKRPGSADSPNKVTGKLSAVNLQYLRKIIDYCHQNNRTVYLVRSPQHRDYEFLSNESTYQKIRNQYFGDVKFLDFNKFSLKDDEYADLGHLNYKGAVKFSRYFNHLLSTGLLNDGMHTASLSYAAPKALKHL